MERADPLLGSVVADRYRLDRRIASTDISVVYEAEALGEARRCAVKILHAAREDVAARCIREAEAMARVVNPHVVVAFEHGLLPSRNVFIAMEFLDGEPLSATLEREGPLPWRRVIHLGRQIAEAAAATHAEGLIHRDIKPGNCMRVDREGDPDFVKLLDFGISRNLDARFPTLTAQGAVLGTPAYMAPELTATGEPSILSDIYSFGATLYQLITGLLPFTGETLVDYYYHHCYTPLVRPSQRAGLALPEGVEALVLRAMSKAPEGRFESMIAVINALDALLPEGERPPPVEIPERVVQAPSSASLEAETITSATPRVLEEAVSDVDTNLRSPGIADETPVHETELGDGTPLPFAATRTAATPGMSLPARSSARTEAPLPRSGLWIRGAVIAAMFGLFTVGWELAAPAGVRAIEAPPAEGVWVTAPPPLRPLPPRRGDEERGAAAKGAPAQPEARGPSPAEPVEEDSNAEVEPPAPNEPEVSAAAVEEPRDPAPPPAEPKAAESGDVPFPSRDAKRAARRKKSALERCASRHDVKGLLKLRAQIASDGRLVDVAVRTPAQASAALTRCLRDALAPVAFPAHAGGGSFEITVELPMFLPLGGAK